KCLDIEMQHPITDVRQRTLVKILPHDTLRGQDSAISVLVSLTVGSQESGLIAAIQKVGPVDKLPGDILVQTIEELTGAPQCHGTVTIGGQVEEPARSVQEWVRYTLEPTPQSQSAIPWIAGKQFVPSSPTQGYGGF